MTPKEALDVLAKRGQTGDIVMPDMCGAITTLWFFTKANYWRKLSEEQPTTPGWYEVWDDNRVGAYQKAQKVWWGRQLPGDKEHRFLQASMKRWRPIVGPIEEEDE